jgi:hypothetical protein
MAPSFDIPHMTLSPDPSLFFIAVLPSASNLNIDRRMEDSEKIHGSIKSSDEKHSFEDVPTPTSATSVTRFLAEKLLSWGVEVRGAYRILISEPGLS